MKQFITLCAIVSLFGLSGASASANQLAAAEKTLVLHYAFDGAEAGVVKDKSGKGNDGTIHGASFVKLGDGYALELNGTDDYVSCPITPSLDLKDVVSVEVWIRPADYAENETAIVSGWPVFGLCQGGGTGDGIWYAPKGHGTASSASNSLTPNQWHHVVGTYDNGRMTLFMDGELIDSTESKVKTLGPETAVKELWIGKTSEEGRPFFEGKIGEIRIYHRALSPFEVGKRHDATRDLYLADSPPPPMRDYPKPQGDLAAHYTFDEGSGDTLRDQSGNENHGEIHGAEFVKLGKGHALRFDGKDDFVDCGNGPAFDLTETVSLEAWVYPAAMPTAHLGILGKGIGSYGLTYYVYGDCHLYISNGHQTVDGPLVPGTWQHIVGTFDGLNIRLYINGELKGSLLLEDGPAKIRKDDSLLIGSRAPWDGHREHFYGIIDEVRIYNRALSEDEVRNHYDDTRQTYGLSIVPTVYYFRGDVITVLDYRGLGSLDENTMATVAISPVGEERVLFSKSIELRPGSNMDEVTIHVGDLQAGTYEVTALVGKPGDAPIATALPKTIVWPDPPPAQGGKVLNNLVSELLSVDEPEPGKSYAFTNPRDGWVFLSAGSAKKVFLSLGAADEEPATIEPFNEPGNGESLEIMRDLSAGTYRVQITSQGNHAVEHLVVRTMPEIVYSYYPSGPFVRPFGPYDEAFMEKHIFRNANCVVSRIYNDCRDRDHVKRWKREGRRWLAGRFDVPNISGKPFTVDGVADYIMEDGEFEDPFVDGIIASEFFGGDDPKLTTWAAAVRKVHARYPDKKFYPWVHALYSGSHGHTFIEAIRETGGKYAWERYLREQSTQMEAYLFLNSSLIQTMQGWRTVPGAEQDLIICFGIFNTPHPSLNACTNVDFKVLMDMRYNIVANNPAFRGLGGVMEYNTYHADRESLVWAAKLWRHYCIEGNTSMLSEKYGFTYGLDYIQNGDFDRGTTGWTLSPAAAGSMALRSMPGSGSMMHGAWPVTPGEGDDFIWTKRVAEKPNMLSQKIENLKPGKLYSIKMITADHGDFSAGKSVEKAHAVSIEIDDAEIIPEVSFSYVKDMAGRAHPPFEPEAIPWINYHYRVFRAKGETSTLRISDWENKAEPGGSVGQELMFGSIELAPYLED